MISCFTGRGRRERIVDLLLILLAVATLCFIFSRSLPDKKASSEESKAVMEAVRPVVEPVVGEERYTEHFVRKLAHFTEFCLLGAELGFLFRSFRRGKFLPFFLLMTFALCDETIQIFTGRGPAVQDVWLDLAGGTAGFVAAVLLCLAVSFLLKRRGASASLMKK